MAPLYETLAADSVLEMDQAVLDSMRAKIEEELKKLEEKWVCLLFFLFWHWSCIPIIIACIQFGYLKIWGKNSIFSLWIGVFLDLLGKNEASYLINQIAKKWWILVDFVTFSS